MDTLPPKSPDALQREATVARPGRTRPANLRDCVQPGQVKMWPTPCANEDAAGTPDGKMQRMLGNHPDVRGDCTGGSLSPDWVEWLMGWPVGWTAIDPPVPPHMIGWEQDPAETGDVPRIGQGIANRAARLKAIGNGQVPAAAALAWRILTEDFACQETQDMAQSG